MGTRFQHRRAFFTCADGSAVVVPGRFDGEIEDPAAGLGMCCLVRRGSEYDELPARGVAV